MMDAIERNLRTHARHHATGRRSCAGGRHRRGQDHHRGQTGRPVRAGPWRRQRGRDHAGHAPRGPPSSSCANLRAAWAWWRTWRMTARAAGPAGPVRQQAHGADRHQRPGAARARAATTPWTCSTARRAPPAGAQCRQPGRRAGRVSVRLPAPGLQQAVVLSKVDEGRQLGPALDVPSATSWWWNGIHGQNMPRDWDNADAGESLVRLSMRSAARRPSTPRPPTWAYFIQPEPIRAGDRRPACLMPLAARPDALGYDPVHPDGCTASRRPPVGLPLMYTAKGPARPRRPDPDSTSRWCASSASHDGQAARERAGR